MPLTFDSFNRALKGFKEEILTEVKKELDQKPNKSDLDRFATKDDMQDLRTEMTALRTEVKLDAQELADHVSDLFERHANSHQKTEAKIQNHEKRIEKLETSNIS